MHITPYKEHVNIAHMKDILKILTSMLLSEIITEYIAIPYEIMITHAKIYSHISRIDGNRNLL